jgi:hypothetical protein
VPSALDISIFESLVLLDGDFAEFAGALANDKYAVWPGVMSIAVIRRRSALLRRRSLSSAPGRTRQCAPAVTDLAANPVSALPSDPVSAYRNAPAAISRGDIGVRHG